MDPWDFREPAEAWTHFVGLLAAIPAAWILASRPGIGPGKRASLVVYGLSLIACYALSTLFHGVHVSPDRLWFYYRLDAVGIFSLIAGTYTPLAWNLMRGRWRVGTLTAVWATAGTAIAILLSGRRFSSGLGTTLYLLMGWGVVVCYARIARLVSHRAMLPLLLGGVSYSVGAVVNLAHWPELWPPTFGAHALFHLFVMVGSLVHYQFIADVVVPFRWGDPGHHLPPEDRPTSDG